jgi:hypothetical protein
VLRRFLLSESFQRTEFIRYYCTTRVLHLQYGRRQRNISLDLYSRHVKIREPLVFISTQYVGTFSFLSVQNPSFMLN